MNKQTSKSLWRRLCSTGGSDLVFIVLLLGIFAAAVREYLRPVPNDPATMGWALGGALVFGLVAAILSRLDRKLIEEYSYRLMAQGAIVGIVATMLVVLMFDLFFGGAEAMSAQSVIFVLMTSWAVGYFYHRWRGLDV